MKRKMIKALEAAAEDILSNGLNFSSNYICVFLQDLRSVEARKARKFFLRIYSENGRSFFYFDKFCRTFNGASEEVGVYSYVAANQHRLMAIALAITLLRDRDFSLE